MDLGDENRRVVQLIDRVGIDFQPTPEYTFLLKDSGAGLKLIDAVTHAKRGQPVASAMSDATFSHLAACIKATFKKQFGEAETECKAATTEEPAITLFALGNTLLHLGNL
jgi:hypothetical protein